MGKQIKPIAIYLPQFHPIPENDSAWGKGFTEWTNVEKAKPLFNGHYQPHTPDESIGYYDLRNPEVLVNQAALAKEFGIYGFCFYHYWFNGKRLLEKPLDNMLKTGKPDFPFCYTWANENWTKKWDGLDDDIIQKQQYSFEDDINHIRFLCKNVFSDKRYLVINEKPVFLVYRTELLPDIKKTAEIWRNEAKAHGFKDLYLIRIESVISGINPSEIGFDAALEFTPDWRNLGSNRTIYSGEEAIRLVDYTSTILRMMQKEVPEYPWYRSVFMSWDNTPRRKNNATVFIDNTSELFRHYVFYISQYTRRKFDVNDQFFFINAWNEWGEGCHLEPDKKNGQSFIEEIKRVLKNSNENNLSEYIRFLQNTLEANIQRVKELEEQNNSLQLITDSKAFKVTKTIIKPYNFLKELFK